MSDVSKQTIQELRDEGYAVIVWTPEELGNCPRNRLEDLSIERGAEVIEHYGEYDNEYRNEREARHDGI